MNERRFSQGIDRLRDPQRVARLEVGRVVNLVLEGLKAPQTILDVGTGSGLFAEQFAANSLSVSGVDVNPEMLEAAKHYVTSGIFKEAAAEKLPFADHSFDLTFMGLLLHETDDGLAALRESKRVTCMRLAILEWPYEEQTFGPPLEHRLAPEKVSSLMREAGFKNVEIIRLEYLVLYRADC